MFCTGCRSNFKMNKYDVVIVGGGIAGVSCAYNCSTLNLKTLLIEKENYLGGDITGSLVIPVMKSDSKDFNCDFYKKLVETSKQQGAQFTYSDSNQGWFNPVLLKCVLDEVLKAVNCDVIFEAEVKTAKSDNDKILSLELVANGLSLPVVSKYFVDATGTASLAKLLNCSLWDDTQLKQPPSLRFIVGGVDLNKLANFLEKTDNDKDVTTTYRVDSEIHLSTACTWDKSRNWALYPYFQDALKKNILDKFDLSYFQIFTIAKMPSCVAFNCPRIRDFNKDNPLDYSNALIEARKAIIRLHNFAKQYLEGFENSYIINIAPKTGQRETARVRCQYDYTIDDIINQTTFKNPAVFSDYPVDIHSNTKNKSKLIKVCSYTLPVESLKSRDYQNLYAIGKIAGCDFKSHGALRIQSACMSMGEAAAKDICKILTNVNYH